MVCYAASFFQLFTIKSLSDSFFKLVILIIDIIFHALDNKIMILLKIFQQLKLLLIF